MELFWHSAEYKVNRAILKITQWFSPYRCCFCGCVSHTSRELCGRCQITLPWLVDRCYRCGLRLEDEQEHLLCGRCQDKPPHFDRLCALFSYDPPVSRLITGLKFGGQLANGRILGELLEEKTQEWYQGLTFPEALLPVPLHPRRLRQRGFNQSLELIRPFLNKTKIPVLSQYCKRRRHTKPQSGLNQDIRHLNLKNAFQVQLLKEYSHVAVIDDVVTTGSTVNALSLALKQQGVQYVDVWCICRA